MGLFLYQISANAAPHLEKVCVRRKIGRKLNDLNDLDKNTLGMFSASWCEPRGEFTFHQESGTTNCEAIVGRVHGAERDSRSVRN